MQTHPPKYPDLPNPVEPEKATNRMLRQPVGVVMKDAGGAVGRYPDARGYHITEDGILHIRGDKGNLASYAPGCWSSAALAGESR